VSQELSCVGAGVALIPIAAFLHFDLGAAAGEPFQFPKNVPNRGGFPAADVVHLSNRGVEGGYCRIDTVADLCVAPGFLPINKNGYGARVQQCLNEFVVSHVGALSWTINGKIAQKGQGKTSFLGVGTAEVLACQFGRAIRT
jgi:hypothetical protein